MNSSCCNSFRKCSNVSTAAKCDKSFKPFSLRRTVLVSKNVPLGLNASGKCFSTGGVAIQDTWKTRKVTKSDGVFINKQRDVSKVDKCSDELNKKRKTGNILPSKENVATKQTSRRSCSTKSSSILPKRDNKSSKSNSLPSKNFLEIPVNNPSVHQYFRNEKFHVSQDSVNNVTKNNIKHDQSTLQVIREVSKDLGDTKPSISDLREKYDHEELYDFIDTDNLETLRMIKEFRERNYFECHSSRSRIESKCSTTSLTNHKCVYRFYLNERLFPVPLCTDHHDNIRCVECHLPLNVIKTDDNINGTIQAKVNLNDDATQDTTLLLPVKDNLIIKSIRKPCAKDDTVYFGIIKLNAYGHSKFNSTIPEHSLALKYQKGYKEFHENRSYIYKPVDANDVIKV